MGKNNRKFNRIPSKSVKLVTAHLQTEAMKMLTVALNKHEVPKDYYIVFFHGKNFSTVPKDSVTTYVCNDDFQAKEVEDLPGPFFTQDSIRHIFEDFLDDYDSFVPNLMDFIINLSKFDSDTPEAYERMKDSVVYEDFLKWTKLDSTKALLDELGIRFLDDGSVGVTDEERKPC